MKYNKSDLKVLIKECLIELLAEGLGGQLVEASRSPVRPPARRPQQPLVRENRIPTVALKTAIQAGAKGNPVLADILADTAMTTLQSQLTAEGRGPVVAGDAVSMAVAQSTPEELFGDETASKWADLAFNTPNPARG